MYVLTMWVLILASLLLIVTALYAEYRRMYDIKLPILIAFMSTQIVLFGLGEVDAWVFYAIMVFSSLDVIITSVRTITNGGDTNGKQ